ncbi:hypothetical protein DL96DRAFT_1576852 [Flagelloscypha sp. PMI_526]|nr:hypothetical protein DL96DRAFT_1576852 [Flagelloscypha sp. PMI_526]
MFRVSFLSRRCVQLSVPSSQRHLPITSTLTRRTFHRPSHSPTRTSFKDLYPYSQTSRSSFWSRVWLRKDGSRRSWKVGLGLTAIFGICALFTVNAVSLIEELETGSNDLGAILHIVFLDQTSFETAFPSPSSDDSSSSSGEDRWDSEATAWSESSYRHALSHYRSVLLCNLHNPGGDVAEDEDEQEDNEKITKLLDVFLGYVWSMDQNTSIPSDKRETARKTVQNACLDVHDVIRQCREHMQAWNKRETSIGLRTFGDDESAQARFPPPALRDNRRVAPWELCTAVNLVLTASLLQLGALVVDGMEGGESGQIVKQLLELDVLSKKPKDRDYEQVGS